MHYAALTSYYCQGGAGLTLTQSQSHDKAKVQWPHNGFLFDLQMGGGIRKGIQEGAEPIERFVRKL